MATQTVISPAQTAPPPEKLHLPAETSLNYEKEEVDRFVVFLYKLMISNSS